MPRRLLVRDVNAHVKCTLCDGYLVDATAIIECLHAFCRTCIIRYLEESKYCPVCDVQVHKTRPLLSIRSDQTLQDVVYKVVPGLYQNEMQRRREFYAQHPEEAAHVLDPEECGAGEPRFFTPKESISLCLQLRIKEMKPKNPIDIKDPTTRHLKCPAAFTISHLKKFIHLKFSLQNTFAVDIFYNDHLLKDNLMLMDVAYIFSWNRTEPMMFSYTVTKHVARCKSEEMQIHGSSTNLVPKPEPMEVDEAPAAAWEQPVDDAPEPTSSFEDEKPPGLHPLPEHNSVKLVSVPKCSALLSPSNGFRLKFIHDPDKRDSSRKAVRKAVGRHSSRHKSVLVRHLARLAPYPSQHSDGNQVVIPLPAPSHPTILTANPAFTPIEHSTTPTPASCTTAVPAESNTTVLSGHTIPTSCNIANLPLVVINGVVPVSKSSTGQELPPCTQTDITVTPACEEGSRPHESSDPEDSTQTHSSKVPMAATSVEDIIHPVADRPKGAGEVVSVSSDQASDLAPTSSNTEATVLPSPCKRLIASESMMRVLSADYSDEDDDHPGLVVEEVRLEKGESGSEDAALRRRINAIACSQDEEADVVTDDTETDSGRASDMSGTTRSCGDDDFAVTVGAMTPVPVSEDGPRHKTNSIDHVIKQLYLQRNSSSPQQMKMTSKDESGVLDLSTSCSRKADEDGRPMSSRSRPVANPPVLDLKHRQHNYLPAPIRQHTACPPAPKHPTSPLLLHQLTSHHHGSGGSILQAQLTTGGAGKQNLLRHPLHHTLPYSIPLQGRTFTPTTSTLGPPSHSYKFTPSVAHQAFPSMLSYAASIMNMTGYSPGMNLPSRLPLHHPKETNSKSPSKQGCSKRLSDTTSLPAPVGRDSLTTIHPRVSLHHRSASPTTSIQNHTKGPAAKLPSLRFKKGPNLAVFNPDPNGFHQKLVIKNLDLKPLNPSSSINHQQHRH